MHFLSFVFSDGAKSHTKEDALRAIVEAKALQAERTDPDCALTASAAFAGYLTLSTAGKHIFVPFNIASVFPGTDILNNIVPISGKVSLNSRNPICLSGSATFLGHSVPVADLDFCEYNVEPTPVSSKLYDKIGIAGDLYFVQFKCDQGNFVFPWTELSTVIQRGHIDRAAKLKADYISVDGFFGAISATCLTLKNDLGVMKTSSHVYQEAVICDRDPPRTLFSQDELSSYLQFLSDEVARYSKQANSHGSAQYALKALKRALSFLLMIGADHDPALREELDAVVKFLSAPEVAGIVAKVRIDELNEAQSQLAPDQQDRVAIEIEKLNERFADMIPDEQSLGKLKRIAGEYATAIDEAMTDLFSAAGLSREFGNG